MQRPISGVCTTLMRDCLQKRKWNPTNFMQDSTNTERTRVLPSRWQTLLCWTAGRTRQRCVGLRNLCWTGWPVRGKGHRRWSWAGRRAMGRSRCSARGRCCRGWWRSSHRSGCSDPSHSGAPGLCTVTEDGEDGEGEERQRNVFSHKCFRRNVLCKCCHNEIKTASSKHQ